MMPGLFPLWGRPHQKEREPRFEGHKYRQERRRGGRPQPVCPRRHSLSLTGSVKGGWKAQDVGTWRGGEGSDWAEVRRAPGGCLVTWRGGLKGEGVWAVAEGRGHTVQECDSRLKSRDLGWQRRAQEAFRQGRKTMSTLLGPLFGEDRSGGSGAEERNPGREVPTRSKQELTQLTSGPLQLGGSGWKKKVTVTEGEPKARAAGAWLARLPLNIPDLAHRGSANTWEWTNRKTGKSGLGDKLDTGSGKVDLPELCPEFSSLNSCAGQWCHQQMQGTWRGQQESAVPSETSLPVSPEVLGSVEWRRVMTGPCTTGSLHWPASPSSGPCIPTPSSWVLPQAGTLSSRRPPD